MFKNNVVKYIIFTLFLFIVSFIYINIKGNVYVLKVNSIKNINEANIKLEQKNEIVKIISQKNNDGVLEITLKSVNPGKANIIVNDSSNYYYDSIYVHKFGVITINNFFGKSSCDYIIPILNIILISILIYMLIKKYQKSITDNMYQYKNILYLGIIIFLSINLINQFWLFYNNNGLIEIINSIISSVNLFSIILLPIAFITASFVTISNIILLKREGFSIKNMLGIILGLFFCILTLVPEILNNFLQSATFVDVHNLNGIGYCIQLFIETSIYTVVSYLECILLGTIILAIKAARNIPKFDKDYIIILGCQIKKDGTLTNLLKSRADRAIEFRNMQKENTGKDLQFIASGGKGNDEIISEGEAIKNYLIKEGIKEKNIIVENKSKNTLENIKFSNDIISSKKNNIKVAFSTTNYHTFRAGTIATSLGLKTEGIGAKTKSYFWINAFIREYIAVLYAEKKKHIIILLSLLIVTILIISIIYISNIM